MPGRIRWAATRITGSGGKQRLALYARTSPHTIPGGDRTAPLRHDLALVLDSSKSMGKTDDFASPYSLLLRAVYALFHYLNRTGHEMYMRFAMINFSSKTFYSNWQDASQLARLRKEFILPCQSGGTRLEPCTVEALAREARRPFLAIMVTDGDLDGADKVAEAVRKLLRKGNPFILLNTGGESTFSRRCREIGAEVHILHSAADLREIILGRGRRQWQ